MPVTGVKSIASAISCPKLEFFDRSHGIAEHFGGIYPDQLNGSIVFGGVSQRITLTKKWDLISPNYKEIYYENSKKIVRAVLSSDAKSFCHYEGSVGGDGHSYAALNLCNERISGVVYMNDEHYIVHNSRLIPSRYYEYDSLYGPSKYTCGYESNRANSDFDRIVRRKRAVANKPAYYKKYMMWKDLYVELAIVFDDSMYKKYGSDKKRLFERAKDLANFINAYYQPVRIRVALVGVEIWSESNRVVINTSGDATLDQFLRHRRDHLIHDIPNDHAQLLTNITFSGGVVGKAMKGTMCSLEHSGAVVMDHDRFKSVAPIAATMAHEMGHNFGMEHDSDSCECPQQRCLMAASSSGAGNIYWSSCSMEYLSWGLSHGADYCLKNKPPAAKEPICGNGFVDDGEECDCGLPEVCDNPCCNASNCRFAPGAVCASAECCDISTCQFMPLATICRDTNNECDLPEFCNGKSEVCPQNTYKQNGTPCRADNAFCFNGTCATHDDQCKLIWGSTGKAASVLCYGLNTKGAAEGHCGVEPNSGSYVSCEARNSMCGLLQCTHKTERTSYGDRSVVRMTTTILQMNEQVSNCQTALIDLGFDRQNPGMVPNGAKCGNGKMCVKQKCVSVADIVAENSCASNCHDSGVCNNFGHCHCISGYGGVDCSIPGLGGSIDSGPASTGVGQFNVGVGILIFLLVVLPLITAIVTLLYKKNIIKAPRFRVIDLLFKPRVSKNRPVASTHRDVTQVRLRTFDSNTTTRRDPPILAFPVESPQWSPQQTTIREAVGLSPLPTAPATTRADSSRAVDPVKTASTDNERLPLFVAAVPSESAVGTGAPPRPKRPSEEVLEKVYYMDVAAAPNGEYADVTRKSDEPAASLLSEVLTALDPADDESVILPQRRAPPPPPTIEEESEHAANVASDKGGETKTSLVKDKKRFFESAAKHGSKKMAKDVAPGRSNSNEKKVTLEISEPLNPKISGEPVDQSSSLLVVSHLETRTLPRKKNSDAALSTSATYQTRQRHQRNSSVVEEREGRKRPVSNIVQRSQSTVSGTRPTMAPPPPPPPKILRQHKHAPTLSSQRLSRDDPASTIPLMRKDKFEVAAPPAQGRRKSPSGSIENYYDVIASPADESKDEIYADIDEIRSMVKGPQMSSSAITTDKGATSSSPSYCTLRPSKGVVQNQEKQ